jgi:hypothetical protein
MSSQESPKPRSGRIAPQAVATTDTTVSSRVRKRVSWAASTSRAKPP